MDDASFVKIVVLDAYIVFIEILIWMSVFFRKTFAVWNSGDPNCAYRNDRFVLLIGLY